MSQRAGQRVGMTGTIVVANLMRVVVRDLSRRIPAFKWRAVPARESEEWMGAMKQVPVYLLVLFAILGASVEGTPATVPEPQLPTQAPPLPAVIPQATKAPLRTPEQEATLIEVRKILRESREVAEAIQTPAPLFSDRHRRKSLERMKDKLLNMIEEVQLQAGDITITSTLTSLSKIGFRNNLALAQARYGFTSEAVQTLSTETVTGESLLLRVEALVKSGDVPAAIRLAEMQLPRDGVTLWRQKTATAIFSYIAEEQYKAGDLHARETLNRAIKEKPSSKFAHTTEYIHALIDLGRAQAALGDKVASAETFKQAIDALSIKRKDRNPSSALMVIAKAQGETGDRVASEQTFQRAIELRTGPRDLTCLAWAQAVTGQREAALRSLKLAIEGAEKLPMVEQRRALSDLVPWQLEIGDREGALETIERLRQSGALVNARVLATRFGFFDKAFAIEEEKQSTDAERASFLRHLVKRLLESGDRIGTREKFQQLAREATLLRNKLPEDRSKSEWMLADIALVQAAAGDLENYRQTLQRMATGSQVLIAYERVVDAFIHKNDLTTATQVISEIKEEIHPFTVIFKNLGAAYGVSGDVVAGKAWARQQQNHYEKSSALLGIGQGLMRQHGIEQLWRSQLPRRNSCPDMSKYD